MLHAILNWLYHFFGVSGSGPYYGFWSGAGSDFGELAILGAVVAAARHVNCHSKGCWRIISHPVPGTPFKACRKHHPVLANHPTITAEIMAKAHEEARRLRGGQELLDG